MKVGSKAVVEFIVTLTKNLSHGLWAVSGGAMRSFEVIWEAEKRPRVEPGDQNSMRLIRKFVKFLFCP